MRCLSGRLGSDDSMEGYPLFEPVVTPHPCLEHGQPSVDGTSREGAIFVNSDMNVSIPFGEREEVKGSGQARDCSPGP